MRFSLEARKSRREFFRAAARYGLLAAVTALASLAARRRTLAGQRCINQGICSGCAVFAGCGLPQALSAKRANGSGGEAGI